MGQETSDRIKDESSKETFSKNCLFSNEIYQVDENTIVKRFSASHEMKMFIYLRQ